MSKETYNFSNVKVFWAKVDPANPEAPFRDNGTKPFTWNMVIGLDDKTSEAFKALKMNKFRRDEEGDLKLEDGLKTIAVSKSATFGRKGGPKKPVIVVDTYGNPYTGLIGNGSICNVQCSVRDWIYEGQPGKTADLEAIQILELVEYESEGDNFTPTFEFKEQQKVDLAEVTAGVEEEEHIPF